MFKKRRAHRKMRQQREDLSYLYKINFEKVKRKRKEEGTTYFLFLFFLFFVFFCFFRRDLCFDKESLWHYNVLFRKQSGQKISDGKAWSSGQYSERRIIKFEIQIRADAKKYYVIFLMCERLDG